MSSENPRKSPAMQFVLTGFTQEMTFRVFAFERMGLDRIRTKFAVKADLALVRRYGIQVQELPLLCRNLLDRSTDGPEPHSLTFTENDMSLHAKDRAAAREAAAQKRRPPRRPPSENIGAERPGFHGQEIIKAT